MSLTIIQVAFPFAPVGPDAVGGAEQVLTRLDEALTRMGHRCITVACEGSRTAGELIATPLPAGTIDDDARARTQAAHRRGLDLALRRGAGLVHMHGIDFHACLPPPGLPVLATLHLPPGWYPPGVLHPSRPRTWLNPVSATQHAACPPSPAILPPVGNGVPLEDLATRVTRRGHALVLGRICPEKNQHQALEAGTRAGVPVLLGGQVFPYAEHEAYWRAEVAPRLAGGHRFLGPLSLPRKRRWLAAARCLVSASLAPETSSLVAMEALACGTPVVAFPSGALPEIVEDGVTGFLVRDVAEMAAAIREAPRLDPEACREAARRRFSAERMVAHYLDLYRALIARAAAGDADAA
ncbi:glycosyltransferase [Falsiroseomonas sp. CW058]|uniref:glycosyltransferase n=1 Tax=Falsiroseomonas sp. CW058 TaxID=3388664 RepID=UPI003D31E0E0